MEKKTFDCVVVGSGIGGMCAAALLSHHGYKVLVTEKLNRLGGRLSTQEIEGWKAPTGGLIIQHGTELEKTFQVTGAKFDVAEGNKIAWHINGKVYTLYGPGMWKSILTAIRAMKWTHYRFAFMSMLMILKALAGQSWRGFLNLFLPDGRKIQRRHEPNPIMYRDWVKKYTDDEQLIQINHALVSSLFSATNDFETPAGDVFDFWASMARPSAGMKFGIARKGNIDLINELAKVVIKNGGEVVTETDVKRIKVVNRTTTGIIMSNGKGDYDVDAEVVISNAGPRRTMELAGEESLARISQDYVNEVKTRLRPVPILMGLIESDIPLQKDKGLICITGTKAIVTATTLSLHSDELGPKGKHLMWTCGTPAWCTREIDPELEIRRNEEDLEKVFPQYKEHGRVLKWVIKDIDDELPCMRTWPGYDLPVTTPLRNLFNVGDGVKAPGWTGSPACAKSAWDVVRRIRKAYPPASPKAA